MRMTATSTERTISPEDKTARDERGPDMPRGMTAQRSDGEGRPAAAAAGRVRVLEREAGLLEIALVVDHDAVQVLRAELVHEQPHPGARDDDIVRGGFGFDAEAVLEARAAARQDGDAQPDGLRGRLLFSQELADLFARALRE